MKLEAYITWEIRDKNGQLKDYSKQKANSIVRSFIDILYATFIETGFVSGGVDTTDNTRSLVSNSVMNVAALLNNATYGLVVGTGSTAVAVTQTKLVTKIANGTGSGQLTHGAVALTTPATAGSTRSFTIQRTFTNNSSGSITINEVGIYVQVVSWYFMIDRTLSTKTIGVGTSGTLTYTIGVTV